MLTVVGRPLPNLGIDVQNDIVLYIDLDHADLNLIRQYTPRETYVITNRKREEVESLILDGYYNLRIVSSASQITSRYISQFVKTTYEENQLASMSQCLSALYHEYGTVMGQLQAALIALRDNDSATFSRIMSLNLYAMISSLEEVNKMVTFSRSLETIEENYAATVELAAKAELVQAEAEHYKKMYEDEQRTKQVLEADVDRYKQDITELQEKFAMQAVTVGDVHQTAEYKALEARLEAITAQKDALTTEFEEYKKDISQQAATQESNTQEEVITHLREELKKAQTLAFDQIVNSRMPIFSEATTLGAEAILYFKEVRPTVYLNSFIKYATSLLRIKYHKQLKKDYIIVVLDTLCDQYTVDKYRKRGWAINSIPSQDECVLITNCFDYSRLKSDYNISQYNLILVIDRTHVKTDAVKMKRAHKYYFINTVNDISEFGLDPAYCIGFFAKAPANAVAVPRYLTPPWDDSLAESDTRKRCGKCSSDKILATILEETEVLPRQ